MLVNGASSEEEERWAHRGSLPWWRLCSLAGAPVVAEVLLDPLQTVQGLPKAPSARWDGG